MQQARHNQVPPFLLLPWKVTNTATYATVTEQKGIKGKAWIPPAITE
jgi:hypothetical protein